MKSPANPPPRSDSRSRTTYSGIGTDGRFSSGLGGHGAWSEVADVNGDGRPDVVRVVVERVEVLLNRGPLCARP